MTKGFKRSRTDKAAALRDALSLAEAALESTADGLLIVDREGRIRGFNRRFVQMWRIPKRVVDSRNDDLALRFVLDQLRSPELFLERVRELYAQPSAESVDSIEFKDGRFFERYSRPQKIGSRVVGRVWSFRDVTERRMLEREIAQTSVREQAKLGRELHDSIGQTLTAISLLANSAVSALPRGSPAAERVARVAALSGAAIQQVKSLARGLLPAGLEIGDLEASLRSLGETTKAVFGVPCSVSVRGQNLLTDKAAAIEFYRIAHEAVYNAAKHSRAKSGIDVVFRADARHAVLTVSDDGVGIKESRSGKGLGLAIMRHRAQLVGAVLTVRRGPGGGTVLRCERVVGPPGLS